MNKLKVVERIEPTLIPALFKNFDNAEIALLELIDNAIDDRIEGETLEISIEIKDASVVIRNRCGYGMNFDDLSSFFAWGKSKKSKKIAQLGRYGQGGKAAMGYLAKSCQIEATKLGDPKEYVVEIENWGDRKNGYVTADVIERDSDEVEEGLVTIRLWNLNKKIFPSYLVDTLSETYAPLLRNGQIRIYVNKLPVPGLKLPYIEGRVKKEVIDLGEDKKARVEIGLIMPKKGMSGGFRCYEFGRLIIKGEYFDQKTREDKYAFDKLTGELFIDFDIPLIMNKTNFDKDSEDWREISSVMYSLLDPWIKKLSGSRTDPSKVELSHQRVINEAVKKFREDKLKNNGNVNRYDTLFPDYSIEFKSLDRRLRYQVIKNDDNTKILVNISYPAYKIWQKDMDLYLVDIVVQEISRSNSNTLEEFLKNSDITFNEISSKIQ